MLLTEADNSNFEWFGSGSPLFLSFVLFFFFLLYSLPFLPFQLSLSMRIDNTTIAFNTIIDWKRNLNYVALKRTNKIDIFVQFVVYVFFFYSTDKTKLICIACRNIVVQRFTQFSMHPISFFEKSERKRNSIKSSQYCKH